MPAPNRQRDVEHFDKWSRTYEQSWMQRALFDPAHRAALGLAAAFVPRPESILDVGCGTGRLLREARDKWPEARLTGVDPAPGMVAEAQRLTPGATVVAGSAEALPLPAASADLALSTISFHHWRDQAAGLREIARVLRPGGCFVLVDMSFPGWLLRVFRVRRVHDRAGMRALFAQAGLQVRRQQKIPWRGWLATVGTK